MCHVLDLVNVSMVNCTIIEDKNRIWKGERLKVRDDHLLDMEKKIIRRVVPCT